MEETRIQLYDAIDLDLISSVSGSASFLDSVQINWDDDITLNGSDTTLIVFRLLFFIVGVVGNLSVIFAILILGEYKKGVTYWYMLQLAIADTVFLLILPIRVAESFQRGLSFSTGLCKLTETLTFLGHYSSTFFIVIMCIDRYAAVCHSRPTSFIRKFHSPLATGIISISVWIICLLMCVPTMLYVVSHGVKPLCVCSYHFPMNEDEISEICQQEGEIPGTSAFYDCVSDFTRLSERSCRDLNVNPEIFNYESTNFSDIGSSFESYTFPVSGFESLKGDQSTVFEVGCSYFGTGKGFSSLLYFNSIAMFFIPLIIMAVCFVLIILQFSRSKVVDENCSDHATALSSRRNPEADPDDSIDQTSSIKNLPILDRSQTIIMYAFMVILYLICRLPFHAVHFAKMRGIQQSTEFCEILTRTVVMLVFADVTLNPIIYIFIGTKFCWQRRLNSTDREEPDNIDIPLSGIEKVASKNPTASDLEPTSG